LLVRWKHSEFALLTCERLADELMEIFVERDAALDEIAEQIGALERLAEWVEIDPKAIENLLADPDDNAVVACAVIGKANFLVTYDPHFDILNGEHRGVKILKAIPFLEILREF
jgi:predicted nucleic acid-binding protein